MGMRKWITIVERVTPQVNKDAIIAQMINSVANGLYWDENGKTPDGQQMMSTDDSYDMAATWGHDDGLGTDYDTASDAFKERLTRWAHERYDEVIEKLDAVPLEDGRYSIRRKIKVLPGWKPSDGLGIYWSFDIAEVDPPWASEDMQQNGIDVELHGLVAPQYVDWYYTILANMDWFSGDREQEIRVVRGAPIELVSVCHDCDNGGEEIPVGNIFRA